MKNTIIETVSAVNSNYVGMVALVDKNNKVYLGKKENYHFIPGQPAYYDNKDNSLYFISNNISMYYFLYSSGWVLSQKEMLKHGMTLEEYKEFDELQKGILKKFEKHTEIHFKDMPFLSPEELLEEEVEEL